jgi:hypothetical protein
VCWCMPVIPATQEAEVGESQSKVDPGQKCEAPCSTGGVALSSNLGGKKSQKSCTTKRKRGKMGPSTHYWALGLLLCIWDGE